MPLFLLPRTVHCFPEGLPAIFIKRYHKRTACFFAYFSTTLEKESINLAPFSRIFSADYLEIIARPTKRSEFTATSPPKRVRRVASIAAIETGKKRSIITDEGTPMHAMIFDRSEFKIHRNPSRSYSSEATGSRHPL